MKITQTDRKDIVAALQSRSNTVVELGNKYDVTAGRIAAIYRKETGSYVRPTSKPVRRLSHSEKETIVAEIQAKKATMTELAKRYGVTITAISYVFKKMAGEGLKPQLPQSDIKAIVAELQSGEVTIQDLAMRYHVSPQTISRNFKLVTGKAFIPRLSQQDEEAIVAELQSGTVRMNELATRYGVHPDTISRNFKRMTGAALHPRKLSQKDKETIVVELQSGKKPKELATKYGVSSSYLGQVHKEATGKVLRVNKISQTDEEAIVAALQAGKTTMTALAAKYGIDQSTISHLFKKVTGNSFSFYIASERNEQIVSKHHKSKMKQALKNSQYRAWHRKEKKMYLALGIDWFNSRVLINQSQVLAWLDLSFFILMRKSGLRDISRTPEYPKGKTIYEGDIVQFRILLKGDDGITKETLVKGTVTLIVNRGLCYLKWMMIHFPYIHFLKTSVRLLAPSTKILNLFPKPRNILQQSYLCCINGLLGGAPIDGE